MILLSSADVCNFFEILLVLSFFDESCKIIIVIFSIIKKTLGISEKKTNSLSLILLRIFDFLNKFFTFKKKFLVLFIILFINCLNDFFLLPAKRISCWGIPNFLYLLVCGNIHENDESVISINPHNKTKKLFFFI